MNKGETFLKMKFEDMYSKGSQVPGALCNIDLVHNEHSCTHVHCLCLCACMLANKV